MVHVFGSGGGHDVTEALEAQERGESVVCPKCGAALEIMCDSPTATKHPGIYCPVSPKHVSVLLNIAPLEDFLEQALKRAAEKTPPSET